MGRRQFAVPVATPTIDDGEREALLIPPDGLSEGARAFWQLSAGRAIEAKTLTLITAFGFKVCCEQWELVERLLKAIQQAGVATSDAKANLDSYIKMVQKLDVSLARFKLTAFGKPAVLDKPKAAANPWASVGAK